MVALSSRAGADAILLDNVVPVSTTDGSNFNDPRYTGNPGGFYNGVANILVSTSTITVRCSGSLITSTALLTAAHCVDAVGLGGPITHISATFENGATGTGLSWVFSPTWNGGLFDGDDLGVITLASPVAGITPYSLFTGLGFGATVDLAGFGKTGTGLTGSTIASGTFRHGENQFDATVTPDGDIVTGGSSSGIYLYDFDNGTTACNSIANIGLPSSLGLGLDEVMIAPGDSGGPSFIGGALAGVHSFVASITGPLTDCGGGGTNSSFGDFGGDTRVVANLAFIYAAEGVPEPQTIVLFGSGLAALAWYRRRRL